MNVNEDLPQIAAPTTSNDSFFVVAYLKSQIEISDTEFEEGKKQQNFDRARKFVARDAREFLRE